MKKWGMMLLALALLSGVTAARADSIDFAPYALEQIMAKLSLLPDQLLMVDDLKPGYDMASACGVLFAAAGWAYDIPQIREFMKKSSDLYFDTPSELEKYLFD